jgi:orotidine-5'-phosphate decarboxylase
MNRLELIEAIFTKKSMLCVGLDPELDKIPPFLLELDDPIFEFNKVIIDATKDYCIAYKPNIAFYECLGVKGWISLQKTLDYIPKSHFTIADAKRGDIGNTSRKYAEAFFKNMNFDSITVAPYMGKDSVSPFLEFKDKWVILLGLTSNSGSQDFQFHHDLYKKVILSAQTWASPENLMFVVGATHPNLIKEIRELAVDNFILVPGIGAQGGDMHEVIKNGMNKEMGLLINVGRDIIYASNSIDFKDKVIEKARYYQKEMEFYF